MKKNIPNLVSLTYALEVIGQLFMSLRVLLWSCDEEKVVRFGYCLKYIFHGFSHS